MGNRGDFGGFMIRSMTGFGAGESDATGVRTAIEVRSVNGRFCEISIKLPKGIAPLEGRIREQVQSHVKRGNLSVSVRREGDWNGTPEYMVEMDAGKKYYDSLRQLKDTLDLPGDITIEMIAACPGLLKPLAEAEDLAEVWKVLKPALSDALIALTAMKEREGSQLANDLTGRVVHIGEVLEDIAERAPMRAESTRERLHDKIAGLLGEEQVDPQRLAMEVTLFADRSDITEECVRFRSHCKEFLSALEGDEVVGRRLNFLLQEMNREANTIGSKANDTDISHRVITIKEELEKIREQVQNIE